jgi:hypothetical protein
MTVKENLTIGRGVESINALVNSFQDSQELSSELIADMAEVVSADLQVRDYLMGLPLTLSVKDSIRFAEAIIPLVEEKHRTPWYAILSAYHYENGDTPSAFLSLIECQKLAPDYSLAKLLDRVYKAGWPAPAFASMRDELHPKVVQTITDTANDLISPIE